MTRVAEVTACLTTLSLDYFFFHDPNLIHRSRLWMQAGDDAQLRDPYTMIFTMYLICYIVDGDIAS